MNGASPARRRQAVARLLRQGRIGTQEALTFAAAHPEQVRGVAMLSSFTSGEIERAIQSYPGALMLRASEGDKAATQVSRQLAKLAPKAEMAMLNFPLSGYLPFVASWQEFTAYFVRMRGFGIVASTKDFYWDIRPKPEYGTIEVRVFDTPLTVERAPVLAAYVQVICSMLLEHPAPLESEEIYVTYNYNRFQACRFGLEGQLIDGATGAVRPVHQEVLATLDQVRPHARELGSLDAMDEIERWVRSEGNDARWQRETYQRHHSMAELVLRSANILSGGSPGDVRRRVRELVLTCGPRGRFALGSGNSIPSYVPVENYLALVEEAKSFSP